MRTLRVRLELNKGRKGIPLYKLAAITDEVQRFLRSVGSDLGISAPKEKWLALKFGNGSVSFDAEYQDRIADQRVRQYNDELANLPRLPEGKVETRLSHGTILQFARIGDRIDEDEKVRFGLYANGDRKPKEWHELTKALSRQIAATAIANSKYRGVAQGILHSWYKEASPPYFDLREAATGRIVKCLYDKDDYPQIVRLLEKKTAIIQVIGMITANMVDRRIEEIKAEKFSIAEELSDADFEKFLGMAPDLTGGMTTEAYVSSVRDYGGESA
jgi:hypothetical protein